MASEIRTLRDGDIEIHPRTVAKAVHTSSGTTIDVDIANAKAETDAKLGDVNTVLENVLTGTTLTEVNNKIDAINGVTTGTSTMEKLGAIDATKADLKSAVNGNGATVGDVLSEYPRAVSNGKAGIAAAITSRGGSAAESDTFSQLASKILELPSKEVVRVYAPLDSSPNGTFVTGDGIFTGQDYVDVISGSGVIFYDPLNFTGSYDFGGLSNQTVQINGIVENSSIIPILVFLPTSSGNILYMP